MLDRRLTYRLIGAGIMVLSAAIILPLILDGERPPELDVEVKVTQPPAFPKLEIAPVQAVEKMADNTQLPEKTVAKTAQEITLLPPPKQTQDSISVAESSKSGAKESSAKPIATPAERWTLQVGSFKNKANAIGLVEKLKAAHYDAYSITSGSLYKVYVGPEFKRDTSQEIRKEIKEKFGLNAIVVKFFVN